MRNLKKLSEFHLSLRNYSTTAKPKVVGDENVLNSINNHDYKPKTHPGIFKLGTVTLPELFIRAVNVVLEDYPLKSLVEDGKSLVSHLRDKRPPIEQEEFKAIKQNVHERVLLQTKAPESHTEEKTNFRQQIQNKVNNILKKEVYNWKPVNYDAYNSLLYLISRSAAEYSVLAKIFFEISSRDPEFTPRSLFDFGSGVGTVTWAANLYWKKYLYEYFNVDSSSDMNDLAQILLKGGRGTNQSNLKGVFYRQFLPASNISYDLVVSAYTLLELPSQQNRLETVLNLWNKTNKYLVIIEQGSNHGFQVINEIRDFILHTNSGVNVGHVFSPCPHDNVCPRFLLNDGTPCNFESFYMDLPFSRPNLRKQERYSYVVLKKGERNACDPQWPRVVRQTLIRSRHTICRMCTKNAALEEVIFTASKHGKNLYHCARATKWGDLLPITTENKDGSQHNRNINYEEEQ